MATWGPYLQNLGVSIPFNEVWRLSPQANHEWTLHAENSGAFVSCRLHPAENRGQQERTRETRHEKRETRYEIRPYVLKLLQRQFCSHEPVTGQEAAIHW